MKRFSVVSLLPLALWCLSAAQAEVKTPPSWTQWRGPSGQGYSADARVPLAWSETQNILWKTKLPGTGNSSPIIWGDRLFLTASVNGGRERHVLCISGGTGKILWNKLAAADKDPGKTHPWNGYASPSCATDGKHVYAFFGTPGLFCYDRDGNLVWTRRFGIFTSQTGWGIGASPFLYEDLVIQNCDNDGPQALPPDHKPGDAAPMALVALDKATGEIRWSTDRGLGRGFSTPRLITTPKGRSELVLNGPLSTRAYDPRTGKEIWRCNREGDSARFGEPLPVSDSDTLYIFSGRPGPIQAIRMDGAGDITRTHVRWQSRRKGRDVSTPILVGGLLYAVDRSAVLSCIDSKNGKVLYTARLAPGAQAMASPVLVRGKLLLLFDTGETVVLQPGRKLQIVARNKLGAGNTLDFAASPAIVDGHLFIRSQSHLYCIGEKK